MLRNLALALGLDTVLGGLALGWWLYLRPGRRMARFAGKTDQQHPRFFVDRGEYLPLPTSTNCYLLAEFILDQTESWEIRGELPAGARYYSLTLYRLRGGSFGRAIGPVTLNDADLRFEDPGRRRFRAHLSPVNRGYTNWLDCSQQRHGLLIIRENGVGPEQVQVPTIEVMREAGG